MKISNVNPHIRVASHSTISHNIRQRVIFDYEVIYVERGEFIFQYGDTEYNCKSGDILFICPGIAHKFILGGKEISQPHIHFDITYRAESEQIPISFKNINEMSEKEKSFIHQNYFQPYQKTPFISVKNTDEFINTFFKIIEYKNAKDALAAKAELMRLLSQLICDNFPNVFETQKELLPVNQLKDFIDTYQGLKMDLDEFAKQFSYSKHHIEKMFRNRFGIGLIKYKNIKRMEYALQLLETMSVSAVSEKLGYSSIYAFSRAFKNHYGYPPNTKRKAHTVE